MLHRDPQAERAYINTERHVPSEGGKGRKPRIDPVRKACEERFGDAVYSDSWIVVFKKG